MDAVTFTSLAPRIGSRPMMSGWSEIGTSAMSGGAFSWGSVWSGLKNFGSNVKNYGSKIWNSSTGKQLRDKLKETKFQEKVVDGLATGIHGAIDIARQKLDKELEQRLDRPIQVEVEDIQGPPDGEAGLLTEKEKEELVAASKKPVIVESPIKKRPRDEDLVMTLDEPPSYDEIFGNKAGNATTYPMTRPVHPLARPVLPAVDPPAYEAPAPAPAPAPVVPAVAQPSRLRPSRGNWQNTLSSITGLGVRAIKRRRCWY